VSQAGVSDLTEIRPAMSGKGVMAGKTCSSERVGSREPSAAVVPTAKMRVAETVTSATEMTMAATTMAAAPADRRAG
jgi:hypothetical protein